MTTQLFGTSHNLGKAAKRLDLSGFTGAEGGQTLIETAIVLPTFCLMLFGFFNVMLVLFGYCDANYAAGAAARYASLHSATSDNPASVSDVQAVAMANLYIPGGAPPALSVTYTGNGNLVGEPVDVAIVYQAVPGMALHNFQISAKAFRYITR